MGVDYERGPAELLGWQAVTVSVETARRYLAARNWSWELVELEGAWLARRRLPGVDVLVERSQPTLAGVFGDIEQFEKEHTR